MPWKNYNPNPQHNKVGDCVIRAISKATETDWETAYSGLSLQGFMMADMPNANHVWGAYLKSKGFKRYVIPNSCPDCYTVAQFAEEHPEGMYILALDGHVVTVYNGDYYDSWDSGEEVPLYYWVKEDE